MLNLDSNFYGRSYGGRLYTIFKYFVSNIDFVQCETVYNTVYDDKCTVVTEQKCETSYETVYEQECHTVQDTKYVKECETKVN